MLSSRSIKIALAVAFAICVCAKGTKAQANADHRESKVGISASIQSQQTDLLLPVWASQRLVIIPAFYFISSSDIYTDFGLGIAVRGNLSTGKAVPYLGARFGALIYEPSGSDSQTDYLYGPMVGGEYFLDNHFSVGVEAQLNITKSAKDSGRFGNPDGTNVNTATAILATFYF